MSINQLSVFFADQLMGTLEQDTNARVSFTYDEGWQLAQTAVPLSLSMPLTRTHHLDDVVAPFLDNLLPDNNDVRERWGREFQVSARNPFALLRHVGQEVTGAARFTNSNLGLSTASRVPQDEHQIAQQIRLLKEDPVAWHFPNNEGRFSLAGAQRKFALLRQHDKWWLPTGSESTTHIFKLPVAGYVDQHMNEHICVRLAYEVGLPAERSSIESFETEQVIVVERFDRWHRNEGIIRIHQEDLCQASGVRSESKYQCDGGPSPESIAQLFRANQSASEAEDSIHRFTDILIFNWLIMNLDAHGKNFSILLTSSQMRLAPVYDVASMLPYISDSEAHKLKMAMKVGSEYRAMRISGRHWRRYADGVGLDGNYVVERAEELIDAVNDSIAAVCAEPALEQFRSEMPKTLRVAVHQHLAKCSQQLSTPNAVD